MVARSGSRHESVVAEIAATLERQGEQMLSEREMLAAERAEGEQLFSAELPDRRCCSSNRFRNPVQQFPYGRFVALHRGHRGIDVVLRVDELPVEPVAGVGDKLGEEGTLGASVAVAKRVQGIDVASTTALNSPAHS